MCSLSKAFSFFVLSLNVHDHKGTLVKCTDRGTKSVHINEEAEIRRQLERALGLLPDAVWEDLVADGYVRDHINGTLEYDDPEASWQTLKDEAEKRTRLVDRVTRTAPARRRKTEGGRLETGSFVGPRTMAMLSAMSEFFTGLAHQHPKVVQFRKEVLGGTLLLPDEAHALVASYAARVLSPELFAEWGIPVVGHRAEILDKSDALPFNALDHWLTIRVGPPGITKTVRYAYPREGDRNTRCMLQNGAVVPIFTGLPIESHGKHVYPSWLWPGSVVDDLFELSVELADAFDWPSSAMDEFGRPRNEAAAWFVLTGEAPEVWPLDARWSTKGGSEYLNPQWRIQLTIPPWLPEKEVSRAYRLMQQQILTGRNRLPDPKTLEVARFVWEQWRRNGYQRPPWTKLFKRWRKQHPWPPFKSYNNFRTICMRGVEAVAELNFGWSRPDETSASEE
jgi:hypothetical protein